MSVQPPSIVVMRMPSASIPKARISVFVGLGLLGMDIGVKVRRCTLNKIKKKETNHSLSL